MEPLAPYMRTTGSTATPDRLLTDAFPAANWTVPGDSSTWTVALVEAPWGSRLYSVSERDADCVKSPGAVAISVMVKVALAPGFNAPNRPKSWPLTRTMVPWLAVEDS